MPSLNNDVIKTLWVRDSENFSDSRLAFFAVFVVLIILILVGTFTVNRKRVQRGGQPIYGTRWMTPPSYVQSQLLYNQPRGVGTTGTYVPKYTERATEYDLGHYDLEGNFHRNPNVKSSLKKPEDAHQRSESASSERIALSPLFPNTANTASGHQNGESEPYDDYDDLYRTPPNLTGSSNQRTPGQVEPELDVRNSN